MTPAGHVSTIGRWWPVFAWTAVIFAASSVPGARLDDVGLEIPDKLVHGLEYSVLGYLAFRARPGSGTRAFVVAVLIGIGVGALDENYQRIIPLRDSSAADWLADGLGAAFGAGVSAGKRFVDQRGRRRNA